MYMRLLIALCVLSIAVLACNAKQTTAPAKRSQPQQQKQSETPTAIQWNTDFDKALKQAAQDKKPVMVDFYAEWCGWCKKLDRDTYTDAAIRTLSTQFVNIKVNTDQNEELTRRYGVRGLPTIVFLWPDGSVLDQVVGYTDAPGLKATMDGVLKKVKEEK
jgi:thiol:disulfide interchange protein